MQASPIRPTRALPFDFFGRLRRHAEVSDDARKGSRLKPSFLYVLREIIRTLASHPRLAPHLAKVTIGFLRSYIKIFLGNTIHRRGNIVAIALIEHLGDIVAAEPVSRFAGTQSFGQIYWILRAPYKDVARAFPPVQRIVTVACMTEWLLLWSSNCFDAVWDLHISERICPRCKIAFRKPGAQGQITGQTYFEFGSLLQANCMAAGIDPLDVGPKIDANPREVRLADDLKLPKRFVVIHCSSNEDCKNWSAEKWEQLVSMMASKMDVTVIEVGSIAQVIKRADSNRRDLCGMLQIMETAEVIRRAALFIGIDSGPAHLANAVGTPGVILLGRYRSFQSYNPYSGPYADGTGADLIRTDGLAAEIPVETVMSAVEKRLALQAITAKTFIDGSVL